METDFDVKWNRISKTVHIVFSKQSLKRADWNECIHDVYSICIAYPDPMYMNMYCKLEELLTTHVTKVYQMICENDKILVEVYSKHWAAYNEGAKIVDSLFGRFNKIFVYPFSDPKIQAFESKSRALEKEEYTEIQELALSIWRDIVLMPLADKLVTAVLQNIYECRISGKSGDKQNEVSTSFVLIGRYNSKDPCKLYETTFEKAYLEQTDIFYEAKAKELLRDNDCSQYMSAVLGLLSEEGFRNTQFLHQSSFSKANKACQNRLIFDHIDFLQAGCTEMIKTSAKDDLLRMYLLLRNDPKYLRYMADEVQKSICAEGVANLRKITSNSSSNIAADFVNGILEVCGKSKKLTKELFNGDNVFEIAVDRAITDIVNHLYQKDRFKRSPELVTKYCDTNFKAVDKGTITSEEGLKALENAVMVFRYIEDKDIFLKLYSRALARRLLYKTSSRDMELEMIKELKVACGFDFVSKLQCMYTDMKLSEDYTKNFHERMLLKGENIEPQISINVLQTGSWPLQQIAPSFILPNPLAKGITSFSNFYEANNKGKALTWLHHMSTAEVKIQLNSSKTHIATMSAFQLSIALLFNSVNQLTVGDIMKTTGLEVKETQSNISILVNWKILKCESDVLKTFSEDLIISVNQDFHHKRTKFRLPMHFATKEQNVDSSKEDVDVETSRRHYLVALIARIMKSRKEYQHNELIEEVMRSSKHVFKPSISFIKLTIEYLIEKSYMERHSKKKDTYLYIA